MFYWLLISLFILKQIISPQTLYRYVKYLYLLYFNSALVLIWTKYHAEKWIQPKTPSPTIFLAGLNTSPYIDSNQRTPNLFAQNISYYPQRVVHYTLYSCLWNITGYVFFSFQIFCVASYKVNKERKRTNETQTTSPIDNNNDITTASNGWL